MKYTKEDFLIAFAAIGFLIILDNIVRLEDLIYKADQKYGLGSEISIFISIVLILTWIIASFLFGKANKRGYFIFLSLYFGIIICLSGVTYLFHITDSGFVILSLILLDKVIPLLGIRVYMGMDLLMATLLILGVYAISTISFMYARSRSERTKQQKESK